MKRLVVGILLVVCCAVAVPMPSFAAEPAIAGDTVARVINVNTAAADELQQLPGIGKAIAQRIVAFREQGGYFNSPEDLVQIKGIGQKTMDRIRPMVAFK